MAARRGLLVTPISTSDPTGTRRAPMRFTNGLSPGPFMACNAGSTAGDLGWNTRFKLVFSGMNFVPCVITAATLLGQNADTTANATFFGTVSTSNPFLFSTSSPANVAGSANPPHQGFDPLLYTGGGGNAGTFDKGQWVVFGDHYQSGVGSTLLSASVWLIPSFNWEVGTPIADGLYIRNYLTNSNSLNQPSGVLFEALVPWSQIALGGVIANHLAADPGACSSFTPPNYTDMHGNSMGQCGWGGQCVISLYP